MARLLIVNVPERLKPERVLEPQKGRAGEERSTQTEGRKEATRDMPLGKYYCDYCDKQFQDTAAARRRHLQGSQHHRARSLWYDTVRRQESQPGAFPLLPSDGPVLGQGVCNHFVRTGTCKFGDACRYFHPKPHAVNPALAPSGPVPGAMVQQSNFLGAQPNFVGYQTVDGNSFPGSILGGHTSWGNLPPSLQPPPEDRLHPSGLAIGLGPPQTGNQPALFHIIVAEPASLACDRTVWREHLRLLHFLWHLPRTKKPLVDATDNGPQQQEKGSHLLIDAYCSWLVNFALE